MTQADNLAALGSNVNTSGTLQPASGGTGRTSLTANNVILGNGANAVAFVAPGSNGNVLTSNGTAWTSATPTAVNTSQLAKAWVNWDGGTGSIRASYNVSSVSRTSQGEYTINFTSAFSDANYTHCFSASVYGGIAYWGISQVNAPTTTAAYVRAYTNSASYDPTYCNASFFR